MNRSDDEIYKMLNVTAVSVFLFPKIFFPHFLTSKQQSIDRVRVIL